MGNTDSQSPQPNSKPTVSVAEPIRLQTPLDFDLWSHYETAEFVSKIPDLANRGSAANTLRYSEIDGPGLRNRTKEDILKKLKITSEGYELIQSKVEEEIKARRLATPLLSWDRSRANVSKEDLIDRIRGALWGSFIGDALAMPVHWDYDPSHIRSTYGEIKQYLDAPPTVTNTIMANHWSMNKHRAQEIIGVHLMKGRQQDWETRYTHYHKGMKAGENTLNARLALRLIKCIQENQGTYDVDKWLNEYVTWMKADDHNDTYLDAVHRQFFANLFVDHKDPKECAGEENHDTAAMGGFTTLAPVILSNLKSSPEQLRKDVAEHMNLLYKSKRLEAFGVLYANMLLDIVHGRDIVECTNSCGLFLGRPINQIKASGADDVSVCARVFGLACYISDSFPVILYLANKYQGTFDAVIANTNVGGDNCDRGMALGALCGAAVGFNNIPKHFIDGLQAKDQIQIQVDTFIANLKLE